MKAWMIVNKNEKPVLNTCCCKGEILLFSRQKDAVAEFLPEEGEKVVQIEITIINKKGGK